MDPLRELIDSHPLRGFRGPHSGRPEDERRVADTDPAPAPPAVVLRLPEQAVAFGAHLLLPDLVADPPGPVQHDMILVDHAPLALGEPHRLLRELGRRLRPGGRLALRIANRSAPRRLRALLEPANREFAATDEEHALDALQLLDATRDAGLQARDLVPIFDHQRLPDGLGDALSGLGLDSAAWLGPQPPSHWLLVATPTTPKAGSLLVGGPCQTDDADRAAWAAVLPADWELCVVPDGELAALDAAIAASRGDLLLFAPAGANPDARCFTQANQVWLDRPRALARGADRLAGLAICRDDVLRAGPLTAAALGDADLQVDDWFLRLSRHGRQPLAATDDAPVWPAFRAAAPAAPQGARQQAPPTTDRHAAERFARRWRQPLRGATPPSPPRISLCMIVRDEADVLGECLRRAAAWCDEMVVVDTGSRDDSAEIAAAAGARVLHAAWQDDFAAARNVGLRAATGEWCLVLDADELVDPADAPKVRTAVARADVVAWTLRMRSRLRHPDDTAGTTDREHEIRLTRLFRRLPGVEFSRRIHEQITPSLQGLAEDGLAVAEQGNLEVVVDHLGYLPDRYRARGKTARNLHLLELQLEDSPDDAYSWFQLAEQLVDDTGEIGDPERFRHALERAGAALAELPPHRLRQLPFAAETFTWRARQHLDRGDVSAAARLLEAGLQQTDPTPNLLHLAGQVALLDDRPADAARLLRACLARGTEAVTVRRLDGVGGAESWLALADAERELGQVAAARAALDRAAAAARPGDEPATLAAAHRALLAGDAGQALHELTARLRHAPDSPRCAALAAGLLERMGQPALAARLLGE